MKFVSKYQSGYLTSDGENIFLSSDLDYAVLPGLPEGTANHENQETNMYKWLGGIGLSIAAIIIYLRRMHHGWSEAAVVPAILGFAYIAYRRLFTAPSGLNCKIPVEKIKSFTIDEDVLHLEFFDAENKDDELKLQGFEPDKLAQLRKILLGEDSPVEDSAIV